MRKFCTLSIMLVLFSLAGFSVTTAKETEKDTAPVKRKVVPTPVLLDTATITDSSVVTIQPAVTENPTPVPEAPTAGEEINWWVIAAGGGRGASTNYAVDGTVGQTAVEPGTSTSYALHQGFWQLFGVAGDCCEGRVGDTNGIGGDEPSIGDVTRMIDAKFITGSCDGVLNCLEEADINQLTIGTPTCDDISIGDITMLIDYLFITGPSLGLRDCL